MGGPGALQRRRAIPLLLIACALAISVPALADPYDRLDEIQARQERVEEELARVTAHGGRLSERIEVLDAQRAVVEAQVRALDADIAKLDRRIGKVQEDLSRAQVRLTVLTEDLASILRRLVKRTDDFTERAIASYKAGPTAYLDGLMSSQSFADLVDRYEYYESALDSDVALIEEIERLEAETEARRDEVELERQEIAEAKLRLENDRTEIGRVRAQHAALLAAKRAVLGEKRSLLADVRADQSHLRRVESQLARDEAQIRAALAASSEAANPIGRLPTSGELMWPADGSLTSGYGYRVHPIFGDRRMHTGIDIGAQYGSAVWAAGSGYVAYVGAMSGYGNVVVIDHGGNLATTYNHLSAYSVGTGQRVGMGATVGAVGCTGYCTGPHLHFEVRVNGSPVDPMPYLQ